MLDHIANLVCGVVIPTKMMVASVNDQNITLSDLHPFFYHLAGIYIVIPCRIAQIDNHPLIDQEIHLQLCHIFSWGVKMDFAIQVRTQVIRMGYQLSIGTIWCQSFEILNLERFIGRPRGCTNSQWNG